MVELVIVLVVLESCDLMLPVCIHGIAVIASQSLRHLSEGGQSVRRSDEVGRGGQAGRLTLFQGGFSKCACGGACPRATSCIKGISINFHSMAVGC